MGAGATAWRLNDYTTAAGHYANALILARSAPEQADALYSLGNANYGLARYSISVEAYRAVLAFRITSYNVCYTKLLRVARITFLSLANSMSSGSSWRAALKKASPGRNSTTNSGAGWNWSQ